MSPRLLIFELFSNLPSLPQCLFRPSPTPPPRPPLTPLLLFQIFFTLPNLTISIQTFQYQAFIQALLSTSAFPQKFSFFTVSLVLWRGPMVDTERKYLKFRSANRWKIFCFFFIFVGILEFYGEFWRKVYRRDTYNFLLCVRVCKYLNQRAKRIGEKNGKSFKSVSKTKKKQFYMTRLSFIWIQDWVFTTVYRL